jgi:poly(3-hydroxybutyrate) depolymerase
MRTVLFFLSLPVFAIGALAATDVRVDFTLNTTDAGGAPITENRYYYVYRPDGLSTRVPVPMILVMETVAGGGPATYFHRKANQAGFLVVSCSCAGNASGNPGTGWNNHNPRITGWEDMDYTTEVINRVRLSDNGNDAFICGFSTGGHTAYAYACERPSTLKAASSVDEFMGLTTNIPTAPLPVIAFHGTSDGAVSYTMGKDTLDAWRTLDGLLGATAVMTYEPAPLTPGKVTQATWRGGIGGTQAAFVTIVGGTHRFALPGAETGYDCTDSMWAFFSQFLTSTQATPKIVAQPMNNVQVAGQPASFWVAATGDPPLSYQWQKNGVDIPGATSNWYTTAATTLADGGATFRAVVGNGSGNVTSAAATLTVNPAPADPRITTQPADQTAMAGQPVSFTVAATGTMPLSYQWKKNGMDIVGQTAASLTIPAAITPDSGAPFCVVVSNGSGSVTSAAATLTVKPAPGAPIIITNPARVRVLVNQTGTFAVNAWSRTPMSYQWQKGASLSNVVNVPGATAATYTTPTTTLADNGTFFRCVVSNAAGSTTSAGEMLSVTANVAAPREFECPLTASGQVGAPFRYTILTSRGTEPITYSANRLPAGLSVDPATGVISGTPTVPGTTKVVIGIANSAGGTSATLVLTVTLDPLIIPIEAWRSAHFGASAANPDIAGDLADPDGDGMNNLLEYTNGTDPLAVDVSARVGDPGDNPK